jgi:hypothetical protein
MKKEFIVERNGKSFVLYAGLLDLAHERGLKGITTTLVQIPTALNEYTAIVHATVELRGEPEVINHETKEARYPGQTFTGLGDANQDNVSRMMVPHLIRMAETRAKARALRDAVNVGVTALEELGEIADDHQPGDVEQMEPHYGRRAPSEDEHELDQPGNRRSPEPARAAPSNGRSGGGGSGDYRPGAAPATPKQLQTIQRMARAAGKPIPTENLTRAQASEIISSLIGEKDAPRGASGSYAN